MLEARNSSAIQQAVNSLVVQAQFEIFNNVLVGIFSRRVYYAQVCLCGREMSKEESLLKSQTLP
jgi:hypothetical protein